MVVIVRQTNCHVIEQFYADKIDICQNWPLNGGVAIMSCCSRHAIYLDSLRVKRGTQP